MAICTKRLHQKRIRITYDPERLHISNKSKTRKKRAPVKRKKIYMTMIHCDLLSICQDVKGLSSMAIIMIQLIGTENLFLLLLLTIFRLN